MRKLSVIVPVYNTAADDKLAHCLDSLLGQTLTDMEIIAVDDASTDDSPKVLADYAAEYPDRIRVIRLSENHRQGGARNRGIAVSEGEWIGFLDGDDYADPQMFAKLVNRGEESGADVVGCDYTIVDHYSFTPGRNIPANSPEQTGILDDEKHRSLILRGGSMVVKIYRRSLILENNLCFPEDMLYEDNCAAPLWSMYYRHFEYLPEPLYFYLTVPGSTTHQVSREKCEDRIRSGERFLEECRSRGLYERYREEIEFRYTENAYKTTLFSYMYSGTHRRADFTARLRRMILARVPEYEKNPYYERYTTEEERKLLRLHRRSNLLFFVYYVMLFGYRKMKEQRKLKAAEKAR